MPTNKIDEEKYLQKVTELIFAEIKEIASELNDKRGRVVGDRREMWEETHVIRDFDDVAVLSSFLSDLTVRERQYAGLSLRLNNLKRMLESPYFGRIDFVEDGYGDTEEIYIGVQSLFDKSGSFFLVYDWRAPISSMYYDYGLGRAAFSAPDGLISGEIVFKRQYRVEKGILSYMLDSDLKIDDEILQRELSKAADNKIKTIINSIQREQNAAIRHEAENVFVFGPAGSGKTSVGLHRLAYLLYKHKDSLGAAGVRVFSRDNVFSTYISGVIPELGEEDVQTLDIKTLIAQNYPESLLFYDQYEQIDFISQSDHTADGQTRMEAVKIKYSPGFIEYLESFVKNFEPVISENVYFNKDLICSKEVIADIYKDRTSAGNLYTRSSRVAEYLNRSFEEYFTERIKAVTDFFNDIHDENYSKQDVRELFEEQKQIVLCDFNNRLFPDIKKLYLKIIKSYASKHKIGGGFILYNIMALKREYLYFEDALCLFYIGLLAGKIKKDREVKHILVDEAQDFGALHHKILKNMFDYAKFTVLADTNQALYPEINLTDAPSIQAMYKTQKETDTAVVNLKKSYRSTIEINRFAAKFLDECDESAFYNRHGDEPEIISCEDAPNAAAEIINRLPDSYKTVGILLSNARAASDFYKKINGKIEAGFINSGDDDFLGGVMVMAAPFAKGLEFDAVIIPEYGSKAFSDEKGRRTLYLICTRALHGLYLIDEAVNV